MGKFLLLLTACFLAAAGVRSEDLKPPMPLPPGDGADVLPPPLDLNQLTPLPLPAELPVMPAAGEPAKKEAAETQAGQTDAALKILSAPSATPTKAAPAVKASEPTATPVPVVEKAAAPTFTPEPKKETAAPPKASTVTFADYFPTLKGTKWSYEYLKPEAGTKVKKTRTVESAAQEQVGGVITATFQVTEDGKTIEEKYSLSDNKVAQTSSGARALTDEFAFQYPSATAAAHWTGSGKTCKASFGKGQVYKKIYPDCVIVTEKNAASTVISYYAKGIGLVAVEVYGKGLKLDLAKSFALVSK